MKIRNVSDKPVGYDWDGKRYEFKPGETVVLEDYLGEHFITHLNREDVEGVLLPVERLRQITAEESAREDQADAAKRQAEFEAAVHVEAQRLADERQAEKKSPKAA